MNQAIKRSKLLIPKGKGYAVKYKVDTNDAIEGEQINRALIVSGIVDDDCIVEVPVKCNGRYCFFNGPEGVEIDYCIEKREFTLTRDIVTKIKSVIFLSN